MKNKNINYKTKNKLNSNNYENQEDAGSENNYYDEFSEDMEEQDDYEEDSFVVDQRPNNKS